MTSIVMVQWYVYNDLKFCFSYAPYWNLSLAQFFHRVYLPYLNVQGFLWPFEGSRLTFFNLIPLTLFVSQNLATGSSSRKCSNLVHFPAQVWKKNKTKKKKHPEKNSYIFSKKSHPKQISYTFLKHFLYSMDQPRVNIIISKSLSFPQPLIYKNLILYIQ